MKCGLQHQLNNSMAGWALNKCLCNASLHDICFLYNLPLLIGMTHLSSSLDRSMHGLCVKGPRIYPAPCAVVLHTLSTCNIDYLLHLQHSLNVAFSMVGYYIIVHVTNQFLQHYIV